MAIGIDNGNPVPQVGSDRESAFRQVTWGGAMDYVFGGKIIDGSLSRDPLNTGDVDVLRAGLLMGKITASDKYAPSIIGTLGDAYDGTATQMNLLYAAEATELTRRIGSSGTFKVTGPPTAGGTVRTSTVTYSAVGSGTGVDEVQTFTSDADSTAGTYRILLQKPDGTTVYTAAIAHGAVVATVQAAVTLALGGVAGWVVTSSGTTPFTGGPDTLILTASGTGYAKTDFPMCSIDVSSLTGVTSTTDVQTTRGVPVAGTVTITALGTSADEVHTITFDAAITAGILDITYYTPTGEPIRVAVAWNTNIATTISDWNTASTAAATVYAGGASNGAVLSGTATVLVLTFSGVGFTKLAIPDLSFADVGDATGPVDATVVQTTAAVTASANDFVAGSLVQPTDGSETILTMIDDGTGVKVTDQDNTSQDTQFPAMIMGGGILAANMINYGSDTSIQAYIKAALRAVGKGYAFDDDF